MKLKSKSKFIENHNICRDLLSVVTIPPVPESQIEELHKTFKRVKQNFGMHGKLVYRLLDGVIYGIQYVHTSQKEFDNSTEFLESMIEHAERFQKLWITVGRPRTDYLLATDN